MNNKEKHVAVSFGYGPSNTQMYVYRLKSNGYNQVLSTMGDQGVEIDAKGKIHMYWKKYLDEAAGMQRKPSIRGIATHCATQAQDNCHNSNYELDVNGSMDRIVRSARKRPSLVKEG
ncbi:hypothetical protein [Paenibacillus sp. OV219]|uniref:hypothetical protein n=1 Tax=Paenibacillus sp. OV219 TaxID=1884377 RepID=UPI0008D66134|nr:hypothetical protein [Paenibacillus sp. OV219]SEN14363.1 hypothetical protein SAMN05518847_102264 [Paenibacillus sp. OV219]